jgi:hypothetical protein
MRAALGCSAGSVLALGWLWVLGGCSATAGSDPALLSGPVESAPPRGLLAAGTASSVKPAPSDFINAPAAPARRTMIAVDIDGTISHTSYGDMLLDPLGRDTDSEPVRDAAETLHALHEHYEIAYVTARPRYLRKKTREWLDLHDFPDAPVIHSPSALNFIDQAAFKREVFSKLRRRWPHLLIGIGDRDVDSNGYGRNGMLPLIVNAASGYRPQAHDVMMSTWRELRSYLLGNREVMADAELLSRALRRGGPIPQRFAMR